MTPQLLVQDFGGFHNADPEGSRARILTGGSYKPQRVVVVLPCITTVPAKCVLSWWNLAFPPNNGVVKILALGMEVGDAYSSAIENVMAHPELKDWEYLLTIEHDNLPPPDGVVKLIDRMEQNPHLAAIGGLYWTKGEGGICQRWGDPSDPMLNFRPQPPPLAGELGECCGLGMGFTLFRIEMFKDKRLPRPLFKTKRGLDGEGMGTQDLMFWTEARKYGYRCAVDAAVRVGHYDLEGKFGPPDMVW